MQPKHSQSYNTIFSIDGSGAYDTIARPSMLRSPRKGRGSRHVPAPWGNSMPAPPHTFGTTAMASRMNSPKQKVVNKEAHSCLLLSLGQRTALQSVTNHLRPGKMLFTFLDPWGPRLGWQLHATTRTRPHDLREACGLHQLQHTRNQHNLLLQRSRLAK